MPRGLILHSIPSTIGENFPAIMKTETTTGIHNSGSQVDEMENEHSEARSRDEADMIRMGKAQQTKVRTLGEIKPTVY